MDTGTHGVHLLQHPLIQHKLTLIRDNRTGVKEFRELTEEMSLLMAYEVTRDLPLHAVEVITPVAPARSWVIEGKKLAVVAILRAGLGMVPGITRLIPGAKVGHVGIYRDPETLEPMLYYCKLPADIHERDVVLVDPMLATGGSVARALDILKEKGARTIKTMCLIAAPEGIALVRRKHPDAEIYAAAVDERLNDHGYIVPGLGDAGDRLFGTK
ncbi:MAG: uracil phosphoribosyltransferase [Firmicutes bacterium]|jgi:uracil phosphoribosyltransferase|nr:uracil phosphoribosyltransferase [Bacillota bacterium]